MTVYEYKPIMLSKHDKCCITGCNKLVRVQRVGLCAMHYQYYNMYGVPYNPRKKIRKTQYKYKVIRIRIK